MGTRRGAQRQQESDAFEAANPFLARVDTRLEVELADADEWGFGSSESFPWGHGSDPDEFDWDDVDPIPDVPVARVTQDGEEVPFYDGGNQEWPGFSTTSYIYTPVGELEAEADDEDAEISMSEYGFGVLSYDEEEDLYDVLHGSSTDMGAFALNDDEILDFDVYLPEGPGLLLEHEGDGPDQGAVSFEIEYMVLGGSGQLGLQLSGYSGEEEDPAMAEFLSGGLSEGDTGTLSGNLEDGPFFDEGEVFVSGSLQVAIVGITVTTNFEGELAL